MVLTSIAQSKRFSANLNRTTGAEYPANPSTRIDIIIYRRRVKTFFRIVSGI
jgi:hypothetical protein